MNRFLVLLGSFLSFSLLNASSLSNHQVGVFCGTDEAIPALYKDLAFELGKSLALAGHGLVTGGGNTGLMGAVVNGFIAEGKALHTRAVIPALFKPYNAHHQKIPENNLVWTDTIHQRLQTFNETCDTLVILPGGFGTLHELMDFLVPKQWGLVNKPIVLVNADHYWDHLLAQFKVMVEKNALKQKHLELLIVTTSVEECIQAIQNQDTALKHEGLNDRYWEKKTETASGA